MLLLGCFVLPLALVGVAWIMAYNWFVWTLDWDIGSVEVRLPLVHYMDLDIPSCIWFLDLTLSSAWWTCVPLILFFHQLARSRVSSQESAQAMTSIRKEELLDVSHSDTSDSKFDREYRKYNPLSRTASSSAVLERTNAWKLPTLVSAVGYILSMQVISSPCMYSLIQNIPCNSFVPC